MAHWSGVCEMPSVGPVYLAELIERARTRYAVSKRPAQAGLHMAMTAPVMRPRAYPPARVFLERAHSRCLAPPDHRAHLLPVTSPAERRPPNVPGQSARVHS